MLIFFYTRSFSNQKTLPDITYNKGAKFSALFCY